mgnify:CR=1 FL=1
MALSEDERHLNPRTAHVIKVSIIDIIKVFCYSEASTLSRTCTMVCELITSDFLNRAVLGFSALRMLVDLV